MEESNTSLCQQPDEDSEDDGLIAGMLLGHSTAMHDVVKLIRQVVLYPSTTVLLQGESGTGKDVVARAIHELSSRASYQFVPINCAAIPETLLETELFGVEAGAFTDAKVLREGYFMHADGGTLFLDEIGSMPLVLQSKLLRFLETRSFRRVGGMREIKVDLRVISATNVDLQSAVSHKTFRDDLYYRLNVINITLPPLRERPEDIEPLVQYLLPQLISEDSEPLQVSTEAMKLLVRYSWPGNVRELRSALQLGQILCDNNIIQPKDLPASVRRGAKNTEVYLQELLQQLHVPSDGIDLGAFLGNIEWTFIQEALERCRGNQVQAAALLGISRDQLRYRLSRRS